MATKNQCIPYHEPGHRISARAKVAVTGKRFVDISDGIHATDGTMQVSPASAGGPAFGVAGWDAGIGEAVTVLRQPLIVPVTAGGQITAGEDVEVGADGKAVKLADGVAVGRAVSSATSGADCQVALYDGRGVPAEES